MKARFAVLVIVALIMVALQTSLAHACPGCKQALATADGEQANMVNGYFWSILFMLSMPFTLFGAFSGAMYLAVRKARRERAGQGGASEFAYLQDQFAGRNVEADREVMHERLTVAGSGV